jgi:hypothetical protein
LENELRIPSQIMSSKAMIIIYTRKEVQNIGRLDETAMSAVSRALIAFFGLAIATMQ